MSDDAQFNAEGSSVVEWHQIQARYWEPEAQTMLDQIGLRPGAQVIELGCGAMSMLALLSRRVGPQGKVVGLDIDPRMLEGAAKYVRSEGCTDNVELKEGNAFDTHLPTGSFDLAHVRLMIVQVGRGEELVAEMKRLVKPGGVVVLQEMDPTTSHIYPRSVAFETLKELMEIFLNRAGGEPRAGTKIFSWLKQAKLKDVQVRANQHALQNRHPYMRTLLRGFQPLREAAVENGLITERELDRIYADIEERVADPDTCMTTFTLLQAWGTR